MKSWLVNNSGIPVFFEPTDPRKATKPFESRRSLAFASPNINELIAMCSFMDPKYKSVSLKLESILNLSCQLSTLVDNLIITMGEKGVLIVRKGNQNDTFFCTGMKNEYIKPRGNKIQARLYELKRISNVVNVSGAGDCFAGGFIFAMLMGKEEDICMSVAFEAAKRALMSKYAVPEEIFDQTHKCWSTGVKYTKVL